MLGRLRNIVWFTDIVNMHIKSLMMFFVSFQHTWWINGACHLHLLLVWIDTNSLFLECALFTSDDIEIYKLVLSTWMTARGNAPPITICIDQRENITTKIAEVLLDTIPRYYIWNIIAKLPAKLKGIGTLRFQV